MISKALRMVAAALLAWTAVPAWSDHIVAVPTQLFHCHISSDGRVAVGYLGEQADARLNRWSQETGFQELGRDTGIIHIGDVYGPAISGDGTTVAATILSESGTYATAGVWTQSGGWRQIVPPGVGTVINSVESVVYAISRDGKVVSGMFFSGDSPWLEQGFMWSEATGFVNVGSSDSHSAVSASNADGTVLAGWDAGTVNWGRQRPAVWVHGVMTLLDGERAGGQATAVNGDGTIIVGTSYYKPAMWKWQDGAWVRTVLHVPDPKSRLYAGRPEAISDDGRMIVGISNSRYPDQSGQGAYGFVWTSATGMITADAYMKSLGYDVEHSIFDVQGLTPNGLTMVAHGGCDSFCLIRRVPSELDASKQ